MLGSRSVAAIEADLTALRIAAERAGLALACLFSSSDEFEAAVISARRRRGAFRPRRRPLRSAVRMVALTFTFLML
jgi:hypothetical protein